jgi:hypothetical protein
MRRRIAPMFGLLVACGLANPVARHPDGSPPTSRIRIGVASMKFVGDCTGKTDCTVQLSMGHTGTRFRRVDVVAARLMVGGTDLGEVPVRDVTCWDRGAYRTWDHLVWPMRTSKLAVQLGPIAWEAKLGALGLEDYRENVHVEIELAIEGERVVARSMFAVQRTPPESERLFIVT